MMFSNHAEARPCPANPLALLTRSVLRPPYSVTFLRPPPRPPPSSLSIYRGPRPTSISKLLQEKANDGLFLWELSLPFPPPPAPQLLCSRRLDEGNTCRHESSPHRPSSSKVNPAASRSPPARCLQNIPSPRPCSSFLLLPRSHQRLPCVRPPP